MADFLFPFVVRWNDGSKDAIPLLEYVQVCWSRSAQIGCELMSFNFQVIIYSVVTLI